jgi:hypothetical protein
MELKRINETIFPTEKQLQDILHNLKQKFPKDKFVISSEISSTDKIMYYSLFRLKNPNRIEYYVMCREEWSDFLTSYKEFMKGENNE